MFSYPLLFDAALHQATVHNDWTDMVCLATNRLILRGHFVDILSWLPRADLDAQQQLLQYIADYFIELHHVTDKDLALIERFPPLAQILSEQ